LINIQTKQKIIMKQKLLFSIPALLISSFLWVQTASAQGELGYENSSDQWRSSLFGYLWALGMDGTAGIGGNEIDIDLSFSDLLDDLDAAMSLRFESHKGKHGYFLDGMYTKLKPEANTPIGTISQDVKRFVGEAGGIYHFNPKLEGLYGLRYQSMDVDVNLPGMTIGGGANWTDIFVGLRVVPVRTDKWHVWLRGDVGGGDSESAWNAVIGTGYRFNERWTMGATYRILANDVVQDNFKWDVNYEGVGVILGYTFQPR
jgi:hypothetical protein